MLTNLSPKRDCSPKSVEELYELGQPKKKRGKKKLKVSYVSPETAANLGLKSEALTVGGPTKHFARGQVQTFLRIRLDLAEIMEENLKNDEFFLDKLT